MSLNRMILCSTLKNDFCNIVTKSQVVTKFNVTKSRLHSTMFGAFCIFFYLLRVPPRFGLTISEWKDDKEMAKIESSIILQKIMLVLNEMNRRLAGQSFPSRVLKEKMENSFVTAPFWTCTLKVIISLYMSSVQLFL